MRWFPVPKINVKFLVFSMVGVFNTAFDIVLYTVLRSSGQSVIVANVISASAALIGSYIINSRITFKSKKWSKRSFIGFVAVTLFGLWVLQTSAIYGLSIVLRRVPESAWAILGGFQRPAKLALPKVLATGVTFLWNYAWYNNVIFKDSSHAEQAIAALQDL